MSDAYFNQTVLSTRPAGSSDDFESRLKSYGIGMLQMPMIEIHPPDDWKPVDDAIDALEVYSGVVFTSSNAVKMFIDRLLQQGRKPEDLPSPVSVGDKTAEALKEYGIDAVIVNKSGGAAELASALGDADNQYYLHPTSDKSRAEFAELIAKQGGKVNTVYAYRTKSPTYDTIRELDEQLIMGEIDCVAFFSPSAIANFTALIPEFKQATVLIAAIGGTTASAAMAHGLRVDVIAEEQTAEALADAIASRFESNDPIDFNDGEHVDLA